jgi:hypothetical protein
VFLWTFRNYLDFITSFVFYCSSEALLREKLKMMTNFFCKVSKLSFVETKAWCNFVLL